MALDESVTLALISTGVSTRCSGMFGLFEDKKVIKTAADLIVKVYFVKNECTFMDDDRLKRFLLDQIDKPEFKIDGSRFYIRFADLPDFLFNLEPLSSVGLSKNRGDPPSREMRILGRNDFQGFGMSANGEQAQWLVYLMEGPVLSRPKRSARALKKRIVRAFSITDADALMTLFSKDHPLLR